MLNWEIENWQNLNLLVKIRVKMKVFFSCHALANTGTFVMYVETVWACIFIVNIMWTVCCIL